MQRLGAVLSAALGALQFMVMDCLLVQPLVQTAECMLALDSVVSPAERWARNLDKGWDLRLERQTEYHSVL
jgi:hypothetical protein